MTPLEFLAVVLPSAGLGKYCAVELNHKQHVYADTLEELQPQIDEWIDRPYNNLVVHQAKSPSVQVNAALKAVPNSIFSAVELGPNEHSATRVLVAKNAEVYKVYIHPESLEILKIIKSAIAASSTF